MIISSRIRLQRMLILNIGFITILSLTGCAHYNARPLKRLNRVITPEIKEQSIYFSYYVFKKEDCQYYLDRDVIFEGYQPIQISISNNSEETFYFSPKSLSLPSVPIEEVAQKVHTSTAGRAAGYSLAGLFLFPFFIPAIVDGVKSSHANEKLDTDFNNKSFGEQTINSYTTINGLVFIPVSEYEYNFSFVLTNTKTNKPIILSTKKLRHKLN